MHAYGRKLLSEPCPHAKGLDLLEDIHRSFVLVMEDRGFSMANFCIVRQGRMGVVVSKLVNLLPGRTLHEVLQAIDRGMICITLKTFES